MPCPYFRLKCGSGIIDIRTLLSTSLCQFSPHKVPPPLEYEDHPMFGTPCISYHICGVAETLHRNLGITSSNDYLSNIHVCYEHKLFLLCWFSIVGPTFGYRITPKEFLSIKDRLLAN